MTVLVAGGADYDDYERLCTVLDTVAAEHDGDFALVNGGCRGADQLSTRWARERGFKVSEITDAIWKPLYINTSEANRNQFIVDSHRPDRAIVFPGGSGTLDMLQRLFHAGIPTQVVGE